ncbi:ROK family protein [Streptomyces sp. NPDC050560]|uniref:ROK family protein n=1 Tax=Streptomyces sp. NPDC050560 TaxID=3365630 RepID=UPI003789E61F
MDDTSLTPRARGRDGPQGGSSEEQILLALRTSGPASRADLARTLGLSRTRVGQVIGELLREKVGLPVYVGNHGNLAVMAERIWGAGRRVDDFIWIGLDANVGGGICSGGQLLSGRDGFAGELGHIVVDPDGESAASSAGSAARSSWTPPGSRWTGARCPRRGGRCSCGSAPCAGRSRWGRPPWY